MDVEISGGPLYKDDEDAAEKQKKFTENKLKEKGEGDALKHPDFVAEEKDMTGKVDPTAQDLTNEDKPAAQESLPPVTTNGPATRQMKESKKEKKKRAEAEKQEKKERKRRKAEENGSIPMQLILETENGTHRDTHS